MPSRNNRLTGAEVTYRVPDSDMRIVRTLFESKPGLTERSASIVPDQPPDPTRRTSARATSLTTKSDRALF